MCIRDRLVGAELSAPWGPTVEMVDAAPRGVGICTAQPPAEEVREPVSYTHLTLPTICSV
eukprot:920045-Alexandrium_andersonii.AAC.1